MVRAAPHRTMPDFRPLNAHEAHRLATSLSRRCWPGGADRTEPAALDWVRRWGPRAAQPVPPACSCAAGRCQVCN